jgi:TfoX/Sxy family transcriptional regulator of competence genes
MTTSFGDVVAALSREPGVSTTRMFGSDGLKVGTKTFAMVVKGHLVVKLTEERAREICGGGAAAPFDPGHGRKMKQWISLPASSDVDWIELSREAMHAVAGNRK